MPMLTDPRVDAYIANAAEFARPILTHLRRLTRQACPAAQEAMKWGHPGFVLDGKIVCIFSAFKAHCGLVFWPQAMKPELAAEGLLVRQSMGHLGRIATLADLPGDATLLRLFRRAAELTTSGKPARPPAAKKPRPELPVPKDLAAALKKNARAAATFRHFAPRHRRAYVAWITGARRDETRRQRLAATLQWLAEGKPHNWKYAKG